MAVTHTYDDEVVRLADARELYNDLRGRTDQLSEQKVNNDEMGIVVDGNKTSYAFGASIGQYIILRNSTITGCDDGLYTAAKAIPYNTVIDNTYLTAVSGGGLNSLNSNMTEDGIENRAYHLGFYRDSDGDLCEID